MQKKTTDQIIAEFKKVHGAQYNYSHVNYINIDTKVTIECHEHGEFKQTPYKHLKKQGCPKCGLLKISERKRKTTKQIISEFREIHGNKYDYSKVKYLKSNSKVEILCATHGIFKQAPTDHLSGQGCPKCGITNRSNSLRKTTAQIISEFQKVHGDRFDYSIVEYINIDSEVTIICNEHGEFRQSPFNHLKGKGCRKCSSKANAKRRSKTTEQIIQEFRDTHRDRYNYSKVNYQGAHKKVIIICHDHGEFSITPSHHLNGVGCAECKGVKKLEQAEVIARFREVWGDLYDYSLVDYYNNRNDVLI